MTEYEDGYRLRDRMTLDGCRRCQDGKHWECHGCTCPCSEPYVLWMDRLDEWESAKAHIARPRPTKAVRRD